MEVQHSLLVVYVKRVVMKDSPGAESLTVNGCSSCRTCSGRLTGLGAVGESTG